MADNSSTSLAAKPRVLLVDDEPLVTDGLTCALRGSPFLLIPANSGAAALVVLERIPIDVIVSDEKMPGMSGSELLTVVRQRYPDVVRIMLTGHASIKSAITAIEDGWVYQYLHKPCKAHDLAACIQSGLALRRQLGGGANLAMSAEAQEELLAHIASIRNRANNSSPPWHFD